MSKVQTPRYILRRQCFVLKSIHAFPFYKKCSYKKRPIKLFNHKKQQPIEIFKIRNNFLLTTKKLLLKYPKRCQKADNSKKNTFKSDNRNVVMSKNIEIFFCYKDEFVLFEKIYENFKKRRHTKFWN